jgi:sugar phosphate permease
MAVMAPFLRDAYGLSLAETGVLISASLAGSVVSLIPWGYATDAFGERIVLALGVGSCGACLLAASAVHAFASLLTLVVLAGLAGASVQSASGRAVMAAFPREQRGLALGVRQTAIPISGFLVALTLPSITRAGGVGWGFATLGIACVASAAVGWLVIRDVAPPAEETAGVDPLRDPRLWRVAVGSALVVAPQICVVGFIVLLLHDHRGVAERLAAIVLAAVQILGIAGRIGAGRWSDVVGSRIGPLRTIALVDAVLVAVCALALDAPLVVLVPLLMLAGAVSMSWNGLAFAAAIEHADTRRSGVAIGLQQSVLNGLGAVYPGLFGALVGATSWAWAFAAVAAFPVLGRGVLRALPG